MMSELKARLEAILAAEAASTPGPWSVQDLSEARDGKSSVEDPWWWVWRTGALPNYGGVIDLGAEPDAGEVGGVGAASIKDGSGHPQERADAEFIALAKNEFPSLARSVLNVLAWCDTISLREAEDSWDAATQHLAADILEMFAPLVAEEGQ